MKPFIVALGLAKLTGLQLIALATKIIDMLPGVASITPNPTVPDLILGRDAYQLAKNELEQAKSTVKAKAAVEKQKRKELKALLSTEGQTVNIAAKGDKAIIEATGMPASQEAEATHMETVENLGLSHGDDHGWVDAHWDSQAKKGARNYTLRTSSVAPDEHGNAPWVIYPVQPTESSIRLEGFTPGSPLWVDVCANGPNGAGGFSDPAFIIVP